VSAASTRVDVRDVLRELFPADSTGGRVVRAFYLMGIAEEEIKAAQKRMPRFKKRVNAAFAVLHPGELLTYSDEIYRHHCRELIGRMVRHQDIRLATDAEVLVMFSRTSLAAPLASQFAHAMSTVFLRVFPHADPEQFATGAEAWTGNCEEIINDARRRLARDRGHR